MVISKFCTNVWMVSIPILFSVLLKDDSSWAKFFNGVEIFFQKDKICFPQIYKEIWMSNNEYIISKSIIQRIYLGTEALN